MGAALRALSKTELISRVLELQSREAGTVSRSAEQGQKAETSSTEQTKGTEQGTPTRPAVTSLVIASSVRSGQTVEFPVEQTCCGQMHVDSRLRRAQRPSHCGDLG